METIVTLLILMAGVASFNLMKKNQKYKELRKASYPVLKKHYKDLLVEKLTYLNSIYGQEDYREKFKNETYNLKNKLRDLPKDLKSWAWDDAVSFYDSTTPKAKSGWAAWGKAAWYNEFKNAIEVKD